MFISKARKIFTKYSKGVVALLSKLGITANQITIFSFIILLISFYFIFKEKIILGGIFLLLSYLLDAFDGSLARYNKQESPLGHFLDKIIDSTRSFAWLILAYNNYISFELASLCIFVNLTGYCIGHLIQNGKLKNANIPTVADTIIILALLTTQITFFAKIMLIIGTIFILGNITAIVKNEK